MSMLDLIFYCKYYITIRIDYVRLHILYLILKCDLAPIARL
jgi:hypothetical protein